MCHLNIFIKKSGLDVTEELIASTANSYTKNSHGDGVFLSDGSICRRSEQKVKLLTLRHNIIGSNFIISHERLATSGFSAKYTHPFVNERFALVHNGVLSTTGKGSDTYRFFKLFNKKFGENNDIVISIQESLKESGWGWYSMFIYDILETKGYYFKCGSSVIHGVALRGGGVFLTTCPDNLLFVDYEKKIKIEDNKIYCWEVTDTGVHHRKIGTIDQPVPVIPALTDWKGYGWGKNYDKWAQWDRENSLHLTPEIQKIMEINEKPWGGL